MDETVCNLSRVYGRREAESGPRFSKEREEGQGLGRIRRVPQSKAEFELGLVLGIEVSRPGCHAIQDGTDALDCDSKLDRDDQSDCINMKAFGGQHIQWGADALDGIGPIWGAE